jgi:GNAT superfamily N-acetyltransferase
MTMTVPSATSLEIRRATRDDVALILQFIRDLAEYERAPQEVVATAADLLRDGFGATPRFFVELAYWNSEPAGFAFWFPIYSTWRGLSGLYLEDLFVRTEFRGRGIGKALLSRLAQITLENNWYGMRWQVLDWNKPSIEFYDSIGARCLNEWLTYRLSGEPLKRLAGRE